MSYFFAGFTDSEHVDARFQEVFSDFKLNAEKQAIRSPGSFIANYEEIVLLYLAAKIFYCNKESENILKFSEVYIKLVYWKLK